MDNNTYLKIIREKLESGEWNQWTAYAELLIASITVLQNPSQCNGTARSIWAAQTLGRWLESMEETKCGV